MVGKIRKEVNVYSSINVYISDRIGCKGRKSTCKKGRKKEK